MTRWTNVGLIDKLWCRKIHENGGDKMNVGNIKGEELNQPKSMYLWV